MEAIHAMVDRAGNILLWASKSRHRAASVASCPCPVTSVSAATSLPLAGIWQIGGQIGYGSRLTAAGCREDSAGGTKSAPAPLDPTVLHFLRRGRSRRGLEPGAMTTLHSLRSLADADRQTIDEIAVELTAGWPVDSIVLYGSKARGDDTPESDIDLLVLTGRPLSPDETSGMRMAARRIGLRLGTWPELFIRTSDEWWRGVYQAAPIRKEIDAEGIDVVRDAARGPG